MSESGLVSWPADAAQPMWNFTWQLMDGPDDEGIVILNAFYQGRRVFAKASLAGFRTHYPPVNRFGQPQNEYLIRDDLPYNNARPHDELIFQASAGNKLCPPGQRVCVASVTSNGQDAILLQAYYCRGIGNYRLTQQWIFWADGTISPRMYSRGIQHFEDHSHHIYWRFEFGIDALEDNQVLSMQSVDGVERWLPLVTEDVAVKSDLPHFAWAARNKASNRGYYIYPGPHDGVADSFAQHDLWVMRYHADEDRHGDNFTRFDDNLMQWINDEDVDGQFLVVYYCAHLFHALSTGDALEDRFKDIFYSGAAGAGYGEWHGAGPDLVPFQWTVPTLSLRTQGAECSFIALGDTVVVTARVDGIDPYEPPAVNYHWTIVGGVAANPIDVVKHPTNRGPDGNITDSTMMTVTNVGAHVVITCDVHFGEFDLSKTIDMSPVVPDIAANMQRMCELLKEVRRIQVVNPLIDPLGPDNPLDLSALMNAPGGAVELNRIARRLVQITESPRSLEEVNTVARELVIASDRLLI